MHVQCKYTFNTSAQVCVFLDFVFLCKCFTQSQGLLQVPLIINVGSDQAEALNVGGVGRGENGWQLGCRM